MTAARDMDVSVPAATPQRAAPACSACRKCIAVHIRAQLDLWKRSVSSPFWAGTAVDVAIRGPIRDPVWAVPYGRDGRVWAGVWAAAQFMGMRMGTLP
jgi:hypothetical protein